MPFLRRLSLPAPDSCGVVQERRDDSIVPTRLEDQVVDLPGRDRAQGGQLCSRLLLIEDVERPVADGATLQMRVGGPDTEVGTNDDRLDTGGSLLWPRERPDGVEPTRY